MDRSRFIAGLVGPVLVTVAVSLFVNQSHMAEMMDQFAKNWALVFIAGIMTLVAGLAIVQTHNVWNGGWPTVITVLGWLAVIGGVARIVLPREMADLGVRFAAHPRGAIVAAVIPFILGVFLSLKAYR
jgi:hypothetical protein